MPDKFAVDAEGRIIRLSQSPGLPASLAMENMVRSTLSASEISEILALPADNPVRLAYQAAQSSVSSLVSGSGNAAVVTIAAPDGYDVGDVLTATPSTGWTVTGYQWTRDGADISGATSSTYTLVSADGGKLIGCRAVDAVYSAFATIPSYAPTLPTGYLSLDSSVLTLDSAVLSLV